MEVKIKFQELQALGLSPNQYCYLYLIITGGIGQAEHWVSDDDIGVLIDREYIKVDPVTTLISVRNRARKLFGNADSINNVETWVEEWLNIFPDGVKSGGISVKSDKTAVAQKMRKFIKNYPDYSVELIFDATKAYVDNKRKDKFAFMQRAHYFIYKQEHGVDISNLASLCESLKNGSTATERQVNSDEGSNKTVRGADEF